MKNRNRALTLLQKYCIWYVSAIVILTVCISLLINRVVIRRVLVDSVEQYSNLLQVKISQVQRDLDSLENAAFQLETMPFTLPFAVHDDVNQKINASRFLRSLLSTNRMLTEIGIYYVGYPGEVICSSGTTTIHSFLKNHCYGLLDEGQFLSEIVELRAGSLYLIQSEEAAHSSLFLYISPIPKNINRSYAQMICVLDSRYFTSLLEELLQQNTYFIRVEDAALKTQYFVNRTGERILDEDGALTKDATERYLLVSQPITGNITYTIGISQAEVRKEMTDLWRLCLMLMALFALAGIAYALMIARKVYAPIQDISRSIGLPHRTVNELHSIMESVSNLKEVRDRAEDAAGSVKGQLFQSLLFSHSNDAISVRTLLDFSGIELSAPFFLVAEITCGDGCVPLPDRLERLAAASASEGPHILRILYAGVYNGRLLLALNGAWDDAERYRPFFRAILEQLKQEGVCDVRFFLGETVDDLLKLSQSYQSANYLSHIRDFCKNRPILTVNDLSPDLKSKFIYPRKEIDLLLTLVADGNLDASAGLMDILAERLSRTDADGEVSKAVYISILTALMHMFESRGLGADKLISLSNRFIFESNGGRDGIHAAFQSLIADVVGSGVAPQARKEADSDDTTVEQMISYINENYTLYDISLNSVAENSTLSPSYATRKFKENTGYSVKEYIDVKKVEGAKEMLRSSDLSLSGIAKAMGYLDASSFCRRFKQLEGTTPNQYRHRKEEEVHGGENAAK